MGGVKLGAPIAALTQYDLDGMKNTYANHTAH